MSIVQKNELTYFIEMGSVSRCLEEVIQEMKQSISVTKYSMRVPVNTMARLRLPLKD